MLLMMMSLHAPSIHFHLGAWAVTALCIFGAFWVNLLQERNLIPRQLQRFIHPDTVARLDYVANITGIIGLAGVVVSVYFGFLDASQVANVSPLDFNAFLLGVDKALASTDLAYKVQWTAVGVQFFVVAGLLRLYFVTYKKDTSVFDENYVFQIIYSEMALLGFFIMVIVAGSGGVYVYGESILSGIPILEDFLPGHTLLEVFVGLVFIVTILFIISAYLADKAEALTRKTPEQPEQTN